MPDEIISSRYSFSIAANRSNILDNNFCLPLCVSCFLSFIEYFPLSSLYQFIFNLYDTFSILLHKVVIIFFYVTILIILYFLIFK